jgi:hypothetical protein
LIQAAAISVVVGQDIAEPAGGIGVVIELCPAAYATGPHDEIPSILRVVSAVWNIHLKFGAPASVQVKPELDVIAQQGCPTGKNPSFRSFCHLIDPPAA